jgi:hypothetical protein
MLNRKTSRRDFLKSTAILPGGAAIVSTSSWAICASSEDQKAAQIQHIELILAKYCIRAKTVGTKDYIAFAERFTEINGLVNYRSEFANIDGEAKLVKQFIQSKRPGVISSEQS